MKLRFLGESDFDAVHQTFLAAFDDYAVPIQVDADQLRGLMHRRGGRLELSVGACEGDVMVAVMATSVREFEGVITAYDVFTGVVPRYRGRGLAGQMFDHARPELLRRGVRRFLLEVIDSNAPAIRAYERAGFVTHRRFRCREIESVPHRPDPPHIEWTTVDRPDWSAWTAFADRRDSWQNSRDSIAAVGADATCLVARAEGVDVGAAIVVAPARDLPWYAVNRQWRRRGIGTGLLRRALGRLEGSGPLRVINVDSTSTGELAFLDAQAARPLPSQLEMVLEFGE